MQLELAARLAEVLELALSAQVVMEHEEAASSPWVRGLVSASSCSQSRAVGTPPSRAPFRF